MAENREGRPAANGPADSIPTEGAATTVDASDDVRTDREGVRVVIRVADPQLAAGILDATAGLATARPAEVLRDLADQLAHAGDRAAQRALVNADADRLADVWPRAMAPRRHDQRRADRFVGRCLKRWEGNVDPITGQPYRLPKNARGGLRGVWNAGLSYTDVRDFIDDATDPDRHPRDRWRWLMGCCWRVIREARAEAELLAGLEVAAPGDDVGDGPGT